MLKLLTREPRQRRSCASCRSSAPWLAFLIATLLSACESADQPDAATGDAESARDPDETAGQGTTFRKLREIGHIDLISVDFSDPVRKTLLAGVHETKRRLFRSSDGGATWLDIGAKLPADSHFSSAPLVLDARRFLLGACGWGDGVCGVFASADGGDNWKKTSSESPAGQPPSLSSKIRTAD
jgi:hypothetical protein